MLPLCGGTPVLFTHQVSRGSTRTSTSLQRNTYAISQILLLLQHLRNLRPLTQLHTPQVNLLDPIPRGRRQLMTPRPRRARDARIVDTVVDSTERFDTLIHHALDVRLD